VLLKYEIKMPFRRYVEIGRVALINYGADNGKLATIIDVLDENRALIDGPVAITGVKRQVINFRRLSLTDLKVKVPRSIRSHTLSKALKKGDVLKKWNESAWAKKLQQRRARANLTDFDRFKVMILKKKKNAILRKEFLKVKKATPIKAKVIVKKAPSKKETKPAKEAKPAQGGKGKDAGKGGKDTPKDAPKETKAAAKSKK